jgi:hypothetical protein
VELVEAEREAAAEELVAAEAKRREEAQLRATTLLDEAVRESSAAEQEVTRRLLGRLKAQQAHLEVAIQDKLQLQQTVESLRRQNTAKERRGRGRDLSEGERERKSKWRKEKGVREGDAREGCSDDSATKN